MSTQQQTAEQKTIFIITNLASNDIARVLPDANLVDDLGFDSLDLVELVIDIETEFDIDVPDEAAEKWKTVADVTAYVAGLGIQ
jgi:acyl carrier protein